MAEKNELLRRIAHLESRLDQCETELGYLNALLIQSGFPGGVETLKETIEELLSDPTDVFPFISNDDYPPRQTLDPF